MQSEKNVISEYFFTLSGHTYDTFPNIEVAWIKEKPVKMLYICIELLAFNNYLNGFTSNLNFRQKFTCHKYSN